MKNKEEYKTYTSGNIKTLKNEFCVWLDVIVNGDGDKETAYRIEDGKLTIKVEDTFIINTNKDSGKMTYLIDVEKIDEEQEVLN